MTSDLSGTTALVVGASRGLGRHAAQVGHVMPLREVADDIERSAAPATVHREEHPLLKKENLHAEAVLSVSTRREAAAATARREGFAAHHHLENRHCFLEGAHAAISLPSPW